jgi:16S rRNA (cytosine967-C5)-methyltransferase
VYSVCTIEPEEGADVVAAFLGAHQEFEPLPIAAWPPGADGADAADLTALVAWGAPGTAALLPDRSDTDGFFVAAMRRAA